MEDYFSFFYPDLHFYSVQLEEGTIYTVDISESATRPTVLIGTNENEILARNEDLASPLVLKITWTAPTSDTYFVCEGVGRFRQQLHIDRNRRRDRFFFGAKSNLYAGNLSPPHRRPERPSHSPR